MADNTTLEKRISEWKSYISSKQAVRGADVDELEDHLRSQTETLQEAGLSEDEAFLVAVKRMGDLDSISREFANEYSERLWKQLVIAPSVNTASSTTHRETIIAVVLAVGAALALKIPELFGVHIDGPNNDVSFYMRNISILIFPFLVGFFAYKRKFLSKWHWLAVPFVIAALVINLFPFKPQGYTEMLAAIHLPLALWLVVGIAYMGNRWRNQEQRMNFVRFSGEWFIYYVLIALGGGILTAFTVFIFQSIGLEVESVIAQWLIPCGAAGAVIVGAWLVEAKQSVIENMAPVLTKLFTPLFTILLIAFIATMVWTGNGIDVEREVLIGFDLLLVLVVALMLYSISARDRQAGPGRFDKLQFVLVICALIVDVLALWAILARISEFGFTPNRTVGLGLNILLLVNLAGSAIHYAKFLMGTSSISRLERWQTAYLPVYAVWAWFVVGLFPVIFNYQ